MKMKIASRTLATLKPAAKPYEVTDTDLPNFIVRVQPNGNKLYYVAYRTADGEKRRVSVGSAAVLNCERARDKAKKLLATVELGGDPAAAKRRGKTLKEFLQLEYKPWAKTNLRSGEQTVKRLVAAFESLLSLPLRKVNAWHIKKWSTERLEGTDKKSAVKPATVNRDIAHLRAALSRAVEWGIIQEHPLPKVKFMREDDNRIVRYLSPEEEKRLLSALDARQERMRAGRDSHNKWLLDRGFEAMPSLREVSFTDHLKPMVLLTLKTGLRRGELFGLTWEDVSLERAILTVHGDGAKSGRTRHVALTPQTVELLKGWQEQTRNNGLVFPSQDGNRFDNCNKSWKKLLQDANISNFRWHDMRHHYASRLAMNGASLSVIRELLGHQDIKMTLRYSHLSPESKASVVSTLDSPEA